MHPMATRRFSPVLTLAGFYVLLGTLARGVLWWQYGRDADVSASHLPLLLLAGLANDLVESLYLFAPLALYVFLVPDRWYQSRLGRALLLCGSALTIGGLLYLSVVENYFFEEFDARFNLVAFDYLAYPTEVFTDIWEAYPVVKVLLATILVALALTWLLREPLRAGSARPATGLGRAKFFSLYMLVTVCAAAFYSTGALSFSSNRVENELLQNGFSSFFRAARTSDLDYGAFYATRDPGANLARLAGRLEEGGGRMTKLTQRRLDRRFEGSAEGLGRMNVVVVSMESFGAEFSKLHGSARDLMPNFDQYARRGLWFSNAYASGTRTVRGLEAISASFPPIPTVSILRRPGNHGIATWGGVMRELGYETSFLYGGYGYFDNMNDFFSGNGFEVIDREGIDKVRFENIWGVSDEDLYDRALTHYSEQFKSGQPFFSIIMTTSNHKPYTFRSGLESLGIPEQGGGRAAGVKYADFALGYFLREAAKQPWFDQTLFVVVADHGARVYGKAEIPLRTYEIPLMIYAPGRLAPRRIDTLTTQIDIAPTVLGLLGLPYEAPFFGVDVLNHPEAAGVALFSHNHDVAVYHDGRIAVLGLGGEIETYRYERSTDRYTPIPEDRELSELGIAYFQTASEMFKDHRYE